MSKNKPVTTPASEGLVPVKPQRGHEEAHVPINQRPAPKPDTGQQQTK